MDALLVNEPGVEGGQVEDEAFPKLFSKDKKKKRDSSKAQVKEESIL